MGGRDRRRRGDRRVRHRARRGRRARARRGGAAGTFAERLARRARDGPVGRDAFDAIARACFGGAPGGGGGGAPPLLGAIVRANCSRGVAGSEAEAAFPLSGAIFHAYDADGSGAVDAAEVGAARSRARALLSRRRGGGVRS